RPQPGRADPGGADLPRPALRRTPPGRSLGPGPGAAGAVPAHALDAPGRGRRLLGGRPGTVDRQRADPLADPALPSGRLTQAHESTGICSPGAAFCASLAN